MPYGLYISAEGAHAQSKRLEVLSNNLANVDTPGFKRDLALFQARLAEEVVQGQVPHGQGHVQDQGGGIWLRGTATDFSPGVLKRTDIPTDFAVNGDGFFVVEKEGEKFLTRAGNFFFNSEGTLVTPGGHTVLSDAGTPVVIAAELPWQATADGGIQQGPDKIYLGLERPQSLADLSKQGENLFLPLAPTEPVPLEERDVRNNYLELSSVKPTLEMMELIETSRAFEANINMIKNHDTLLGALVNRVLRQA
ncbi:MAG: flagellar hook-basal body protein [Pirellulales bacterium]|nr:flagellar hook-basal body protein [Pirellulales bacterium]